MKTTRPQNKKSNFCLILIVADVYLHILSEENYVEYRCSSPHCQNTFSGQLFLSPLKRPRER